MTVVFVCVPAAFLFCNSSRQCTVLKASNSICERRMHTMQSPYFQPRLFHSYAFT